MITKRDINYSKISGIDIILINLLERIEDLERWKNEITKGN